MEIWQQMQLWACPYLLASILQMLSFITFSAPLPYMNLSALIKPVTPEIPLRAFQCVRRNRHCLSLIYCKLHGRRYTTSWELWIPAQQKTHGGEWRWEGWRETRLPSLFKGELKYMYWVGAVIKRSGWGDAGWEQIWKAVEYGGKAMEHHRRIGWNYLFIIRGLLHGCLLHCPVTDEAYLFKWAFHSAISPPLG